MTFLIFAISSVLSIFLCVLPSCFLSFFFSYNLDRCDTTRSVGLIQQVEFQVTWPSPLLAAGSGIIRYRALPSQRRRLHLVSVSIILLIRHCPPCRISHSTYNRQPTVERYPAVRGPSRKVRWADARLCQLYGEGPIRTLRTAGQLMISAPTRMMMRSCLYHPRRWGIYT